MENQSENQQTSNSFNLSDEEGRLANLESEVDGEIAKMERAISVRNRMKDLEAKQLALAKLKSLLEVEPSNGQSNGEVRNATKETQSRPTNNNSVKAADMQNHTSAKLDPFMEKIGLLTAAIEKLYEANAPEHKYSTHVEWNGEIDPNHPGVTDAVKSVH